MAEPKRLLPVGSRGRYMKQENELDRARVLCDYVAGMTDDYATRIYERLFIPREGGLFDKL